MPDRPVAQMDAGRDFFARRGFAMAPVGVLWHLLKVAQLAQTDLDRIVVGYGISYADFQLLGALMMADPEPQRPSDIAPRLNVSNAVLSVRCRKLAAKGLLAREIRAQDRRAAPMRLTAEGAKCVQMAAAALEQEGSFLRHFADIAAPDQAVLDRVLRDLHARLDRDFLPATRSDI
jgi:DNA-binding MarR family transcriptional regulator